MRLPRSILLEAKAIDKASELRGVLDSIAMELEPYFSEDFNVDHDVADGVIVSFQETPPGFKHPVLSSEPLYIVARNIRKDKNYYI